MKLFIAGTAGDYKLILKNRPKYVLESFYYVSEWQKELIQKCDMFLLDSGAFTFMSNTKKKIDWKDYIDKYIDFINENDIKYFFELDIDKIVGYDNVKAIRKYIEQRTNKKTIPVWHRSRGLEEWKRLTEEYDYVAIGGFAIKDITRNEYRFIPELLKIARKNNCRVHGLGFTAKHIETYGFFSVDSTTWLQARRFGELSRFDGKKMVRVTKDNKTKKGKPEILEYNLKEWLKYQEYLERF